MSLDLEVDGAVAGRSPRHRRPPRRRSSPSSATMSRWKPISSRWLQDTRGREAPPERVRAVEMALAEIAAGTGVIRDVHDARARGRRRRDVNFHCRVDPALTVQAARGDDVERARTAPPASSADRPYRADAAAHVGQKRLSSPGTAQQVRDGEGRYLHGAVLPLLPRLGAADAQGRLQRDRSPATGSVATR